MTYSKLGNIKSPQGRRGLNMTGGATTPPAVDDDVLKGGLWLDSTTGDVYRATDPWAKDGTWHTWDTVLWKAADNVLMVQPAEGDTGTTGEPAHFGPYQCVPWGSIGNNPSVSSMTSVRSKEGIAMNANSTFLFFGYASLTDISALSGWGTSGVTSMDHMFSNCTSLTDISPLSSWDVSNVTRMGAAFYYCTSLTNLSPLSNWDVSGVTYMNNMFSDCTSLTDLSPISGWDVSNVTNMGFMFCNCKSLADLSPLSGWDVSNVTRMTNMFSNCTSLIDISALSSWDVSNVTYMTNMFGGCSSLTDLSPLSGWDVSGVTYMTDTFSGCTSLTDASILSGWNVSNVTSVYGLFSTCPLERIGIPSLEHGGKKFVSNLKNAAVVDDLDATMLTNTTTHETMSANQILTDMDATPSKYATGTVWTL